MDLPVVPAKKHPPVPLSSAVWLSSWALGYIRAGNPSFWSLKRPPFLDLSHPIRRFFTITTKVKQVIMKYTKLQNINLKMLIWWPEGPKTYQRCVVELLQHVDREIWYITSIQTQAISTDVASEYFKKRSKTSVLWRQKWCHGIGHIENV